METDSEQMLIARNAVLEKELATEAILEKVRARSLAMYKSDELQDVISTVFACLQELNIEADTASILVTNDDNSITESWIQNNERTYTAPIYVSFFKESVISRDLKEALDNRTEILTKRYSREEKNEWFVYLFEKTGLGKISGQRKQFVFDGECYCISLVTSKHGGIYVGRYFDKPFTVEENKIIQRVGNVFSQAYTRFLDLQKAEAQAREAKVEAALEKVRARSLAMHHSDELKQVAASMFARLKELDISFDGALIFLFNKGKKSIQLWIATNHLSDPVMIDLPYDKEMQLNQIWLDLWQAMEEGEHIFNRSYSGDTKNDYFRYVQKYNESKIPDSIRQLQLEKESWTACLCAEKNSVIGFDNWSGKNIPEEEFRIVVRFARVFEQAYTRFLDLQKAEAQARESQVEASLERVRSATNAMHHSNHLAEVIKVITEQLAFLSLDFDTANFAKMLPNGDMDLWISTPRQSYPSKILLPYLDHPVFNLVRNDDRDFLTQQLSKPEKDIFFSYFFNCVGESGIPEERKAYVLNSKGFTRSIFKIKDIYFTIGNYRNELFSDSDNELTGRFAKAFEQTYTRFLDLQKAEELAREAQIEAAMERVRARTMAMHESKELIQAAELLFDQVKQLGAELQGVAFAICDEHSNLVQKWTSIGVFSVPYNIEPGEQRMYEAWKNRVPIHEEVYEGERQKKYYESFMQIPAFREGLQKFIESGHPIPTWQKNHAVTFKYGYLLFITTKPFGETQIFLRFAKVFDQTYTRFLDLQKAEAQALEAIKRASVDRVRAEIASMRTTRDLERITPLIWNELSTLGVPFFRCGVFIMDEEKQEVQSHLSTPDGHAIAAFRQPYNTAGEISEMVASWRKGELYKQHWDEDRFIAFTQSLVDQHAITSGEKYLTENRPADLYLHFVPFLQGMLYAGSITPLTEDELELVKNLADAFSSAYARYEDFNKLEIAKIEVENALSNLKLTQAKLVQSEKMASLGELTAGIAHEIQNPLNFVNNFSEVSSELIEETAERRREMEENSPEVTGLLNDIKENLVKINHHGKRADAIVKGMLQHSRKSEGKREATDINLLCDEYLRLAYHGMRAKDKAFSAALETDFDPGIEKIDIVPQDIARVLLNVINNAFYACSERARRDTVGKDSNLASTENKYHPTVFVSTKKTSNQVLISVKDNGNGIPEKVIDKIFQPFFTTKPTGQGTGLGLSLAYDIVKANSGEIRASSIEGQGSEFIISLNSNA